MGVIAFGMSLQQCEAELRSTLEDWILVGIKLGHALPVIRGIDLTVYNNANGSYYQPCVVELMGFEPTASSMPLRRSPN